MDERAIRRSPGPERDEHQRRRSDLFQAIYAGKRLASFRHRLGAALVLLGVPIIVLGRSADPTIQRVLTIFAMLFLSLVLPMVRLLFMEGHNRRAIDRLRGIVETADEGRSLTRSRST